MGPIRKQGLNHVCVRLSAQQDPTVGWGRSGRAQRSTNGNDSDGDESGDGDAGRGGGGTDLGRESENEDADRFVVRVFFSRAHRLIRDPNTDVSWVK